MKRITVREIVGDYGNGWGREKYERLRDNRPPAHHGSGGHVYHKAMTADAINRLFAQWRRCNLVTW